MPRRVRACLWDSNQDGDEQQRVNGQLQRWTGVGNVNNWNVGNEANQRNHEDGDDTRTNFGNENRNLEDIVRFHRNQQFRTSSWSWSRQLTALLLHLQPQLLQPAELTLSSSHPFSFAGHTVTEDLCKLWFQIVETGGTPPLTPATPAQFCSPRNSELQVVTIWNQAVCHGSLKKREKWSVWKLGICCGFEIWNGRARRTVVTGALVVPPQIDPTAIGGGDRCQGGLTTLPFVGSRKTRGGTRLITFFGDWRLFCFFLLPWNNFLFPFHFVNI